MRPFDFLIGKKDKVAGKRSESTIEPFVFKSNSFQRYENGNPVKGLQYCIRTICVEKNTHGCSGYHLAPGVGYIFKMYNDDLGMPNMSEKPMIIVRIEEDKVELRGFVIEAQSPFGWQEVDYSVYGLIVHYEHGKVSKCVLHMYDRNTFIEYRQACKQPLKEVTIKSSSSTECEQYALMSKEFALNGNTSISQQYGLKVYNSLVGSPQQIDSISNVEIVALALGRLMEGDYFSDNDSILRAVGLTYYFLCMAINENPQKDPYLYVYRFSTIWEYNKVFYHLFAHSEGGSYNPDPLDIFSQSSTAVYNHHMQGMQMADALVERRVINIDPALGNIFNQIYSIYRTTPSEQIISIGNQYHNQVYNYLRQKIQSKGFNF